MKINVKKLAPSARLPVYASESAAGADLCACVDGSVTIEPGQTVLIKTGVAIELPPGYVGLICARSGISVKKGLAPANKVGVIDADYRGDITVALHNHGGITAVISPGERIAQLLIMPVVTADFIETDELTDTGRGSGGYGSTGEL